MNVVDSSGWLEYFADDSNSAFFAGAIEDTVNLIVPSVSLLEVFKVVSRQRGEGAALQSIALMRQGKVIDLDASIALSAAKLGMELKLPLADSVILATAKAFEATLWTQDSDFEGITGVEYIPKSKII